jgi:two-component system, NarL family, response regulator DesR
MTEVVVSFAGNLTDDPEVRYGYTQCASRLYLPAMGWHDMLSAREREVLALLEAGKTVREIAEALHVTPNTVRVYIQRIESKRGRG